MKSTMMIDQLRELLDREARGDFGEEGLHNDLQWFGDNWQTIRELRIDSDKSAKRTWKDYLLACKQLWVTPNFNSGTWPLEPVAVDEDEWEVVEHMFSDGVRDKQTRQNPDCWKGKERLHRLNEMVKKGEIRPCGIRRAMEYVAAHSDIQLNHELVVMVTGPVLMYGFHGIHEAGDLGHYLPVFCSNPIAHYQPEERMLEVRSTHGDFSLSCGWLVLRKRQA